VVGTFYAAPDGRSLRGRTLHERHRAGRAKKAQFLHPSGRPATNAAREIYVRYRIFLRRYGGKSINTPLHNPSNVTRVYKSFFAITMLLLLLASAGCAELPPEGESGGSGLFSPSDTPVANETPEPDPGYLTPATLYPTPTSTRAGPTLSQMPQATPTPELYVTIYNRTTAFNLTHAAEAFSFNLTAPPLIVEYRVEPEMITRSKYDTSDYGTKKDAVYKQTYPSEDSWFKVTVRDRESGTIVAEDGFGNLYSVDTNKQVFIGRSGDYLIELTGNKVMVHITMRAGGV